MSMMLYIVIGIGPPIINPPIRSRPVLPTPVYDWGWEVYQVRDESKWSTVPVDKKQDMAHWSLGC